MTSTQQEWHYLPPIESADIFHDHDDGTLRFTAYANIRSAGAIQYRYMVALYPSNSRRPLLLVTSETSFGLQLSNPGQFALGVFLPDGHRTVEISPRYGEWGPFVEKATEIIENHLANHKCQAA